MGKIMCQFNIKGESPDTDLDKIVENIRTDLKTIDERLQMQNDYETKPLFFGIKAAVCQFIVPEEDGMQDKLEGFIMGQEGVADLELSFTTRL